MLQARWGGSVVGSECLCLSPRRFVREPVCRRSFSALLFLGFLLASLVLPSAGQSQNAPPPPPPAESQPPPPSPPGPLLDPGQLDHLVSRIALYPDPLLAQVLTASTYWDQIPDASDWADRHSDLKGDALADAIRDDNLPWDASVLALLPFPAVLRTLAEDSSWTQQLGNAVLAQRADVMDAVQRMRRQAYDYGYLRTNPYDDVLDSEGDIEILPVNPTYIYIPTYDPLLVFGPPRPGFAIGAAIHFGPAVVIGGAFAPWGWAHPYFQWRTHGIFFDFTPWGRTWANRGFYVHPYAHPWVRRPGPRVERHEHGRR